MWIMFWTHEAFLRNIWLPSNYLIRQLLMEPVEEKLLMCIINHELWLCYEIKKRHKNIEVKKKIVTQNK